MLKIGAIIKELRVGNGLTQIQLGKQISLAESTISLYESGKRIPELATVERLADLFNVTTDYLLGRTKDKKASKLSIGKIKFQDKLETKENSLDYQVKSNFAKRLKSIRKSKKMTQSDLAKLLDYDRQTISNWENGHTLPNMVVIEKIAVVLEIDYDFLVGLPAFIVSAEDILLLKKIKGMPEKTKKIIYDFIDMPLG